MDLEVNLHPPDLFMVKIIIFIDGSNFYRGMGEYLKYENISIDLKNYIFDFQKFIKFIGGEGLKETRYYNVRLIRYLNPTRYKKQRNFFRELEKISNFRVIKGDQVIRNEKIRKCIYCSAEIQLLEIICPECNKAQPKFYVIEKGVDVKIATDMLLLAIENEYDKAILISGDRDFVPVVETIISKYKKHITNAYFPKDKKETAIQKSCTDYIALTYDTYIKQFLIPKNFFDKNLK